MALPTRRTFAPFPASNPFEAIRARVDEWVAKKLGERGLITWYTPEQWAERGEPYGQGATATAVIDGSALHGLLNYPETAAAFKLYDQFYRLTDDLGYFSELGYAWTLHWYPTARLLGRTEFRGGPTPLQLAARGRIGQVAKRLRRQRRQR